MAGREALDAQEVLEQQLQDAGREVNDAAIAAITTTMKPMYAFDTLITEFRRVVGKYPSLYYEYLFGSQVARGELPTWVKFMAIYGDRLIPWTGEEWPELSPNLEELVEEHKRTERMLKLSRVGATARSSPESQSMLTSTGCWHGETAGDAERLLKSGVLRGLVNEGTPDERVVSIELHDAAGGFVERKESKSHSIGESATPAPRIGYLWWWWWWSPYWYWWWWVPYGADVRVHGSDDVTDLLDREVRIGLREVEASDVGCGIPGDDKKKDKGRFELALIEITGKSGEPAMRVTSVVLEEDPAPPIGATFVPRIWRKRKKASLDTVWTHLNLENVGEAKLLMTTVKEDPTKHPWSGLGEVPTKYAMSFTYQPEGRLGSMVSEHTQGVHLMLTERTRYDFDGARIPTKHPFYITTSPSGGKGDKKYEGAQKMEGTGPVMTKLTKKSKKVMTWIPEVPVGQTFPKVGYYYQCAKHRFMGGPITVSPLGRITMLADHDSGALVQYDSHTTNVVVVYSEGDAKDAEFGHLRDAIAHMGMEISEKPVFVIHNDISPDNMSISTLTRSGAADEDDDKFVPAVLTHIDGSLYCDHVHSLADLKQWVATDMPAGSSKLCPTCRK